MEGRWWRAGGGGGKRGGGHFIRCVKRPSNPARLGEGGGLGEYGVGSKPSRGGGGRKEAGIGYLEGGRNSNAFCCRKERTIN